MHRIIPVPTKPSQPFAPGLPREPRQASWSLGEKMGFEEAPDHGNFGVQDGWTTLLLYVLRTPPLSSGDHWEKHFAFPGSPIRVSSPLSHHSPPAAAVGNPGAAWALEAEGPVLFRLQLGQVKEGGKSPPLGAVCALPGLLHLNRWQPSGQGLFGWKSQESILNTMLWWLFFFFFFKPTTLENY